MKSLLGGCLIAAGILVAGATGLCAFLLLAGATGNNILSSLPIVLMPVAVGVGLIFAGRRLIRLDRADRLAALHPDAE